MQRSDSQIGSSVEVNIVFELQDSEHVKISNHACQVSGCYCNAWFTALKQLVLQGLRVWALYDDVVINIIQYLDGVQMDG